MLRDITLGQFFPGDSMVHRLDARVKLIYLTLYVVALFVAPRAPLAYAILGGILLGSVSKAQIPFRAIIKGLKPVWFILFFTAALNMFYTPGRTLASFWVFTLTYEGVETAIYMLLRIVMLISSTFILTYTTSPMRLTDGLEAILSPLKKIKAPVHEMAMMMSIALRFIPNLIEDTDRIMSAQRARGADFDSGGLLQKAKALIPLLVPLFVSCFRRADELAVAMECRCYRGGEGRTKLQEPSLTADDIIVLCACAIFFVGIIILKVVA